MQEVMPAPWTRSNDTSMVLTQLFFGINVAVFVGMVLAGVSITDPTSRQLIDWGANYGPSTLGGEWWRLLTSVFLHIGIIHILFNMWCLWDLGALSESLYGHWTFAVEYLTCGIAGSVASAAWHPQTVSAGASGAIFGLAGSLIASFYLGEFSLPRAAIQCRLRSVITFAGYNLVFGAISGRTDNAAHVGGLVCGLIFGAAIAKIAPERDGFLRRLAVLTVVVTLVGGCAGWLQRSRGYIAYFQRGTELLEAGQPNKAIAELQTAVRRKPDFAPARYSLAHAYYSTSDFANAESELKILLQIQPNREYVLYELGMVYLAEKKTKEARDVFTQELAASPQSADAHYGLGMVNAAEENHQAAIQEFKTVVSLDSEAEYTGTYYKMGLSYAKLGLYDDAIASFQKEQEQYGDNPDTELALADAFRAKGLHQQSADAERKAAQMKSAQ